MSDSRVYSKQLTTTPGISIEGHIGGLAGDNSRVVSIAIESGDLYLMLQISPSEARDLSESLFDAASVTTEE